jgi:MYXO-CTERM domain-containing protein
LNYPSTPINIIARPLPDGVFLSGNTLQIQPEFLLVAADALSETMAVEETAILRFRLGNGAWKEATIAELRQNDESIVLSSEITSGDLEIQIVAAASEKPIGLVTYELEANSAGVAVRLQEAQPDNSLVYFATGMGILMLLGIALLRRRRVTNKDS